MRIAQVAPLIESVPAVRYGGTERVVSYLTEELVEAGHDVTLFASADSITNGHLAAGCERALRYDNANKDILGAHMHMLEEVAERSNEFDLIHFHTGYLHYPLTRHITTPHVTTHHGRLDIPELAYTYKGYKDIPVISVSAYQRLSSPQFNWQATIPSAIPENLYSFSACHSGYLAYLGRISPEKGILEAIAIAQRAGMELKIAAKIDRADEAFFNDYVKPLLKDPRIEFLGELNNTQKNFFLGDAYALLVPSQYPEPFGLGMIEAMACGTPVIAFHRGAAGEILEQGVTGYLVNDVASATRAVEKIELINRKACHAYFRRRFNVKNMTKKYMKVYQASLERRQPRVQIYKKSKWNPYKELAM